MKGIQMEMIYGPFKSVWIPTFSHSHMFCSVVSSWEWRNIPLTQRLDPLIAGDPGSRIVFFNEHDAFVYDFTNNLQNSQCWWVSSEHKITLIRNKIKLNGIYLTHKKKSITKILIQAICVWDSILSQCMLHIQFINLGFPTRKIWYLVQFLELHQSMQAETRLKMMT